MAIIHSLCLFLVLLLSHTTLAFTASPIATTIASTSALYSSTSTEAMPEVKQGDTLPNVALTEIPSGAEKPEKVMLGDLCKDKTVVIFGVPGAYTPGCSKSHLPSFIEAYSTLINDKSIDMVICVATNDAYVMNAWGESSGGAKAGIRFLADDSGELTKALGLEMPTPTLLRMKRFSLVVKNNEITHYFSSANQSSDTWAPAVLAAL